ncbi:MAG: NnrS family protein [Myxococcales bacterium]|nr:NnrS family protein [Myxococcales bacterium]
MSTAPAHVDASSAATGGMSLRRLGAAPHRLLFFAGVTNLLLAMAWWAGWLVSARWPELLPMKYPPVFPGWLHAFVMQFQMLPSFIFGFLLTTFPKWTGQPELRLRHYAPVGIPLIAGQLATLAGALGSKVLVLIGVGLTLVGWSAALVALVPILWREQRTTWHARSCVAAIALGHAGLCAFFAFLLGASPDWGMLAIKLGTFGFSLMIFFTVAHRMFAFFAGNVVPGYVPWRPLWLLAAVWAAVAVRLTVWIAEAHAWLWIPDAALVGLTAFATWRWWPRGSKPGLLAVLFFALAWLPVAMALYLVDDLAVAFRDLTLLGRAPAHALFVGFFGSAIVAMVTRVTQGHSGRPLVMPAAAWFAFGAVQLVAVVRIVSELMRDPFAWFAVAALAWLVAFAPWVVRLARIYLVARADAKPG